MAKTYVIDTNVLIQAPYALFCFEENQVVLPLAVLEELDGLKKSGGRAGSQCQRSDPSSGKASPEGESPGRSSSGKRRNGPGRGKLCGSGSSGKSSGG